MLMCKVGCWGLVLIGLSLAIAYYVYPMMPEQMASHWNASGQVDDYMPKLFGLLLFPAISLLMLCLFLLIPKIDPLKSNIQEFRKYFDGFIMLILLFLFYMYVMVILYNLGILFDMSVVVVPALAGLFYYIGILLDNAKRNWFIGIRTPWTLSSDRVWRKTHRIGAKLFKLVALISVIGLFFESLAIWFVIVPVMLTVAYLFVYSYLDYQKEGRKPVAKKAAKPRKRKR
jgi:uncharacterized membrane protein